MAGPRRSRTDLAAGLAGWLRARDGHDVTVEVSRPPSGLSSETVLVDVQGPQGAQHLVVRLPPTGNVTFPDYDLARQYGVQVALGAAGVPVAPTSALETDESWLGAPFLVMERVPGRGLTVAPPYTSEGWLHDSGPHRQEQVVREFVDQLARLNRLGPGSVSGVELSGGGPELDGMIDYWERYLDWAAPAGPVRDLYRNALGLLRREKPDEPASSVLWGDPQLPNAIYHEESAAIVALLDFEMAAAGPAENDLAWFLTLHEGAAATARRDLPGYPGREAIIGAYTERLGRAVADLAWYELFAHVRSGAIVLRIGEQLAATGVPKDWTEKVPQIRHVRHALAGTGR